MGGPRRSRRDVLRLAGAAIAGGSAGCTAPIGGGSVGGGTDGTAASGAPPETAVDASDRPAGPAARPVENAAADGVYSRLYQELVDSVAYLRVFGPEGLRSEGSTFVGSDGFLITNEHVVDGATTVEVGFSRGDWSEASVEGADVYSDLAVVSAADRPEYAASLPFREGPPTVGEAVAAIGSPFGLERTLTTGVVSGINRSIPTEGGFAIPDAVQTDAAVNPGNSGGPLVDLDGRVVGVIRSASGVNVGFAISAALVNRVVPALIQLGEYRHPYLGIRLISVTPTIARANDVDRASGVLVVDILDDGPSAGVLQGSEDETTVNGVAVPTGGDVIVSLAGEPVHTDEALGSVLALETSPGETVTVTVLRDGERQELELTLGTRPPPATMN